jgi:hypothetical protein
MAIEKLEEKSWATLPILDFRIPEFKVLRVSS